MRLSCKVFGLICEILWPQKGITHLPNESIFLDVVSHVTGFTGHFWPLNWLKLEEVHLVWEGSGRRSQAFYVGVLSWIQNVYTILSTSVFVLSDYYVVTQPTATMNHFFLTNLWGTIVGSEQVWLPFLCVVLFKSVSLIQALLSWFDPKETKSLSWRDFYTPMFITTGFITVKVWKELKCPSIYEWVIMDVIYIYISLQMEKNKYCMVSLYVEPKKKSHRNRD